jgi:hypothetical protein
VPVYWDDSSLLGRGLYLLPSLNSRQHRGGTSSPNTSPIWRRRHFQSERWTID